MTLERFIESRRERWSELERLIAAARRRGLRSLSASEIERLGALYRRVTSDLAIARRDFPDEPIVRHLNDLAARAGFLIYRAEPVRTRRIREFFSSGFPRLFRANLRFTLAAFLIFALGFAWSYLRALSDPGFAELILPENVTEAVRKGEMWTEIPGYQRSLASSLIMTNNIQVSILAFALGISFGLGTAYVLLSNGIMIGAAAGLCQAYGLSLPLWSFVSPHGWIELSVVFIVSGAGLLIGYSLLSPGLLSRREALIEAAKKAVGLVVGCIPLLAVAGLIEGFISPSSLSPWVKIAIGPATAAALYSYLLIRGR